MKRSRSGHLVPPAARASSPARQEEQQLSATAVAVFEQTLGGRARLTEILSVGAASPEDQNNFAVDGFYPMQPFVLFGGSQAVDIKLLLAAAPTAVDTNSRVIMIFRGVQAQQSTPVN